MPGPVEKFDPRENFDEKTNQVKILSEKNTELEKTIETLQKQVEELTGENEELKNQIKDLKTQRLQLLQNTGNLE